MRVLPLAYHELSGAMDRIHPWSFRLKKTWPAVAGILRSLCHPASKKYGVHHGLFQGSLHARFYLISTHFHHLMDPVRPGFGAFGETHPIYVPVPVRPRQTFKKLI